MTAQKFRYVLIGLIVLTLAAGGAAGYFGLQRLHTKVAKAQKVKVDAQVTADARLYALQAKQKLGEQEHQQLANYLSEVIPENSYRNQFIADVSKYAELTGVPLEALSYAASESSGAPSISGAEAVPIQLQLGQKMPYKDFIAFVGKLEKNLQHIQVLSIQIQPSPENRSVLQSASLTVALYVEPEDG